MYHVNVNVNLMVESVIQIKNRIMINVGVSVKNIIYVKKIIFGILLHVVKKFLVCSENGKYLASIMDDSVITCDEIIEETKTVPTNFNEKKSNL